MKGITILHEYAAGGPDLSLTIFCVVCGLICLSIAIYDLISTIKAKKSIDKRANLWISAITLGVALFFALGLYCNLNVPYKTRYKVLIEDSVPYKELVENYKVISQEGQIYIVEPIGEE